jgi:hypothetical protein
MERNKLGAFFNGPVHIRTDGFGDIGIAIHKNRKNLRIVILKRFFHFFHTLVVALGSVKKDIVSGSHIVIKPRDRSIFLRAAACQENQQERDKSRDFYRISFYKVMCSQCTV